MGMDECIDTGMAEGDPPKRKNWYGRLKYNASDGNYTIDLCWGKQVDGLSSCDCPNHFRHIPRLGQNSLGPTSNPGAKDSDLCHKLMRMTSSRLVNSTGKNLHKGKD